MLGPGVPPPGWVQVPKRPTPPGLFSQPGLPSPPMLPGSAACGGDCALPAAPSPASTPTRAKAIGLEFVSSTAIELAPGPAASGLSIDRFSTDGFCVAVTPL